MYPQRSVCFSAIVFNSIVIFVTWKTRSLHTPSNILICGLAVSDLALSGLHGSALYSHLRYKAIITSKRTMICLACSWILSSAWALSRFCLNVRSFATTTGSVIIICLLINTWAYVQVFRLVKRHKTQIESESNHLPPSCSSSEDISKYIKTVIIMVILLEILIGSYAIFVGVTNALAFGFGRRNRRALSTAYTVLSNWIFFTSSLNPVLYCWRLGEIRKAVMILIFLAKSVNTLYTIIGL